MNFGNVGFMELLLVMVVWAVPIALLIWFVRTLTAMSASLRDIGARLTSVEQAIRDATLAVHADER